MRSVLCFLIAISLPACAQAPDELSTSAEVVSGNRIILNRIILNRIILNRIILNRISLTQIAVNRLSVNMATAGELLATPDGRDVFSLVVSCDVPSQVTLVANINGAECDFPGEVWLAPQWLYSRLDRTGQRLVSACMFARLNAESVLIPISMRGPSAELATSAEERATWSLEEGAFFGNAFGPLSEPLQAFACRGKDKAAGDTGELRDRQCAAPDPAHPGFTLCGMIFAGDCGAFAADQTCESFSFRGLFFLFCFSLFFLVFCGDRDVADHRDDDDAKVFAQVITTFATP